LPDLLTKLSFEGTIEMLLASPARETGLEKRSVDQARFLFSGMEGDCHGGLTRKSDSRMLKQYRRGTEVRNSRQVSLLSTEELADIAERMAIPAVKPEWVGANIVTRGIPDLTLLPPSTRLQFPSGAMLVVDAENHPCRYPAAIIEAHHPEARKGFVSAAMHKRGLVGWIEAEGQISVGDRVTIWIPPRRLYAHA
jgi:MOSC domain-containing protein YiiM